MIRLLLVFIFCLIAGTLSFLLYRSIRQRLWIHLVLRRGVNQMWTQLKTWEHHPAKQFELLHPLYQRVVFQFTNRGQTGTHLEQLVSDELNRILKRRWGSGFSIAGRVVLTFVLFGLFLGGIHIAGTEWRYLDVDRAPETVTLQSATVLGETVELPLEIDSPKTLGAAIAYHMGRFDETFTIRYTGEIDSFEETMTAAWDVVEAEHLYFFRLSRQIESKAVSLNGMTDVTLDVTYDMTLKEAQRVQARVEQLVSQMPSSLTDLEKVRYLNKWVVAHTAYNLHSEKSPYTPYSVLFHGEGVCEGYALTMLLLLKEAGIEARYISGEAGGGLHAWNLVKLDGEWYHVDTTWNDPVPDRAGEVGTDYLLVSDATMRQDHEWEATDYPISATTDIMIDPIQ